MKNSRIFSAVFAFLFLQLAALVLLICFSPLSHQPLLLKPSHEATLQTQDMLDAVCRGDYSAAEQFLLGQPSLGVDRPATDEVGQVFWDTFIKSLSYELQGPCFATGSGLGQAVSITCLDIDATSASLGQRSQALLEELLVSSEDTSDVYDENNEYRKDVVMEVLHQAVQDVLAEDAVYRTTTITVNLVQNDGTWWILPEDALLSAISGGIIS